MPSAPQRLLFTWLLPITCLIGCTAVVLVPAFSDFFALKRAANSARYVHLRSGQMETTVPAERFFTFPLELSSYRALNAITILNAPGRIIDAVVMRSPNFAPPGMMPWVWQVFAYPFFAVPLWAAVGRSIDRLRFRERGSRFGVWASIVAAALFATLSLGLRFGMSEADRQNDERLKTAILGFGLWAILLALPLLERLRRSRS